MPRKRSLPAFTRYPPKNILLFNSLTILYYLLGGIGLMIAYENWWGFWLGALYFLFAFSQMYLVLPLIVCPSCIYTRIENALCMSGLNTLSQRLAPRGRSQDFQKRRKGLLCHTNLYLAAFLIPILGIAPGLFISFSFGLFLIILALIVLVGVFFLVIYPKNSCGFCRAKEICPNAKAMRIR